MNIRNPCDFYLWGHINPLPNAIEDLKVNVVREIKKIYKNKF